MKRAIVKNPQELQVIKNPNKPNSNMAKSKKAVRDLKEQAITAGYILGGQALGATANAYIVPSLLGSQNATVQQTAKVGIPAVAGLMLAASKNNHLQQMSLGFGVQSTLELIKFLMPGFTPSEGLMDGSSFIYNNVNASPARLRRGAGGNYVIPGYPGLPEQASPRASEARGGDVEVIDMEEQQNAYLNETDESYY